MLRSTIFCILLNVAAGLIFRNNQIAKLAVQQYSLPVTNSCRNGIEYINNNSNNKIFYSAAIVIGIFINGLTSEINLAHADDSNPLVSIDCQSGSNPSTTTVFCRRVGLVKGRLRGCTAQENCFSSSAVAAERYLPPWSYSFKNVDIDSAWKELMVAVKTNELTILRTDIDNRYILAAEKGSQKQPKGASNFYEFLIRPADSLVLTRAFVDKTVFVYPLQQPVSDFGILQTKLESVRSELGWLKTEQQ